MNTRTLKFGRILVATDFSASADAAIKRAIWVAKQAQGKVVIAHVIADLRHAVAHTSYRSRIEFLEGQEEHFQRELRRNSDEKLKKLIHGLGDTGVTIKYETLLGTPYVELIHSVQQEQYDLVVVGSRGNSPWKQLLLGSTARRLIRQCPASVWVVRNEGSRPPTSIIAAVDLSDVSRRALEQAAELANCVGAQLHVLHVIEHDVPDHLLDTRPASSPDLTMRQWIEREATESFEKLLAPFETAGDKMHRHVKWGTPGEEIVKLAKEVEADVIAIGTVGRSGIQGLLLGNTAEKVLAHCDCDILTVKPAEFQSPIAPPTWSLHPGPERRQEG